MDVIGSEFLGVPTDGGAKFQRPVSENCAASSPTAIKGAGEVGFKDEITPLLWPGYGNTRTDQ
jgi:hypothetical protein